MTLERKWRIINRTIKEMNKIGLENPKARKKLINEAVEKEKKNIENEKITAEIKWEKLRRRGRV